MRREPAFRALAVAALLVGGVVLAIAAPGRGPTMSGTGALRDSCPDPNLNVWGIEWRGNELWTVSWDGTLTRLSDCATAEVVSVNGFTGFATGLGWDTRRNLWIVADAEGDEIDMVDVKGNIVRTFPSPGTGPVGASYDSLRDWVWISDFEEDRLFAMWALNGTVLRDYPLPGHQFWAGAAYDRQLDAVYVHERVALDGLTCHYFSATTGEVMGSFELPYASLNGYNDNAIDPSGTLWIDHDSRNKIYAFDRSTTPTRATTWGQLKAKYRSR